MYKFLVAAALAGAIVLPCAAVETKFWQQDDQSVFERGTFKNISIRSDGRLTLAPVSAEVFDSSTPYLWAIAADSRGNLYAGGGGSGDGKAKLFEIDSAGKSRTVTELDGLEIHALAVRNNEVYAATAPDGKIWRVTGDGKAQVFYDPHAKYIWAMAFDQAGNLYIATGDQGEVHRVTPDGKGSVFFRTEETHARSLALDAHGNLIVGTEPGGLILRITPAGKGFVLYQTPKREVTAVAVAPDGSIYAAAVGTRSSTPATPPANAAPAHPTATSPVTVQQPNAPAPKPVVPTPPASYTLTAAPVSGGSEVLRIDPDGAPHRVWDTAQDVAYAIAFDAQGRPLVGTGNRGHIYRIDSDVLSTMLLNLEPTQVTGFANARGGRLYAITGNIGRVYEIGPALASHGQLESDALDARLFSLWGRLAVRGSSAGITAATRSGNVNRPVNNWSSWAPAPLSASEGALSGDIASPPARFLQYRLELSGGAPAPHVSEVDIAYLPKNVAPRVEQVDITPANYKFPAQSILFAPAKNNLTLPPLGTRHPPASSPVLEVSTSQTMNYAKGFIGARWQASDEDGDTLEYKLDIKGIHETGWKLLKDKLRDKFYSWDSTAFPDGEYQIRVVASDSPSNPPAQALSAELTSDPFLIDNTPPDITQLTAARKGGRIDVSWHTHDARSIIDHAEYSLNGADWLVVEPVSKLSDSPDENYNLGFDAPGTGEQTVAVRVTDAYDNQAVAKTIVK